LRYHRTTGLMLSQMQELTCRVQAALAKPWHKGTGRPKSLGLYAAVEVACMYLRQNATEEFLGSLQGVDSLASRREACVESSSDHPHPQRRGPLPPQARITLASS
jgi:hypothetical protein